MHTPTTCKATLKLTRALGSRIFLPCMCISPTSQEAGKVYRDLYISMWHGDVPGHQLFEGENRNLPIRIVTLPEKVPDRHDTGRTAWVGCSAVNGGPRRCRSLATPRELKGWLCKPASRPCSQILWKLERSVQMKGRPWLGNRRYPNDPESLVKTDMLRCKSKKKKKKPSHFSKNSQGPSVFMSAV